MWRNWPTRSAIPLIDLDCFNDRIQRHWCDLIVLYTRHMYYNCKPTKTSDLFHAFKLNNKNIPHSAVVEAGLRSKSSLVVPTSAPEQESLDLREWKPRPGKREREKTVSAPHISLVTLYFWLPTNLGVAHDQLSQTRPACQKKVNTSKSPKK